jgi:hypothetical protein
MIRSAIVFLLFVFGAFFTGLYLAYDEIDPCRALAVEDARRSPVPTSLAKLWTKIETSGMGPVACSKGLMRSWRDRLSD